MAGDDHERSAHLHARDIDEHAHEHLPPAVSHTEALYNGSWRGGKYLCKGLVVEMVVDEVCSRGGGNVTTRAAHMSSGTRLRCRSIARSSHGPRRAVGQQVAECVKQRRRGGAGLTTFFILCEALPKSIEAPPELVRAFERCHDRHLTRSGRPSAPDPRTP